MFRSKPGLVLFSCNKSNCISTCPQNAMRGSHERMTLQIPCEHEHPCSHKNRSFISTFFFFLHLPLSTSELHHRTLSVLPFPHYTSLQGPSNEWHKNTFVLGTKRKGCVKPESISEALEMSPAESKMNFLNHILLSSSNKISRL